MLSDEAYEILRRAAAADRRSLANLIETAALRQVVEQAFTDESETREILSNAGLLRRLTVGHAQARKRKGAFVRGS